MAVRTIDPLTIDLILITLNKFFSVGFVFLFKMKRQYFLSTAHKKTGLKAGSLFSNVFHVRGSYRGARGVLELYNVFYILCGVCSRCKVFFRNNLRPLL